MRIELAYGKSGLEVEIPSSNVTVIEPAFMSGVDDEGTAVLQSPRAPIGCLPLDEMSSALLPH